MNFFGHVHVAGWRSGDPGFALGAMAPDFAGMAGTRLEDAEAGAVRDGVAFHHATDARFHAAPAFVELLVLAGRRLRAAGLPRGPARAVAHVGSELLLDGRLVDDPESRARYVDALDVAREAPLRFTHPGRWGALRDRLRRLGPPLGYRDPSFVGDRLVGLLSRRPRLALDARGEAAMRRCLPALQREVDARLDALLGHLAEGLAR